MARLYLALTYRALTTAAMKISSSGKGFIHHFAVNHETGEIRQAARNTVLLAGLPANRPAHPARRGFFDSCLQRRPVEFSVEDIIRKMSSVATVKEKPDRFEWLVGSVGDRGHRDRPGRFGLFVHRTKEAPGFYAVHRIKAFMWSELLCGVRGRGTRNGLCQG